MPVPVDIAVIVPCFRPQANWAHRLSSRFIALQQAYLSAEISLMLVEDGTPGGLDPEQVELLRQAVPNVNIIPLAINKGKGFALRTGLASARATCYLYTDVDMPYTLSSMKGVADSVLSFGGIAAGERFDDYYSNVPVFRRLLSKGYRSLMRSLFRLPVSDSQAGLKAFDEAGRQVFLTTTVDRFLVDLDFIARCRKHVEVRPVRVELRPDVEFTDFGLSILRDEASNFIKIFFRGWLGSGG